ncbi:MAG: VCBS repeat-containing protein [Caldilineales bacterium]|nr:VCBS repeat-containing protein [Caldilineales bacterium]
MPCRHALRMVLYCAVMNPRRFLWLLGLLGLTILAAACVNPVPAVDTTAPVEQAIESNIAADSLRQLLAEKNITALDPGPEQDPAKVALGRALFFDKELSGNRDISCATCHHPSLASGDNLSLSVGTAGLGLGPERLRGAMRPLIPRNATELFNRGAPEWHTMFWDSRVETMPTGGFTGPAEIPAALPEGLDSVLAAQAMFPVTSDAEMRGAKGDADVYGQDNELARFDGDDVYDIWQGLMTRLLAIPEYRELFAAAYPDVAPADLGFQHAANAIAAFEIDAFTLLNSPWDRFLAGDGKALSPDQIRGVLLFYGKAGCANCHSGNLFTDQLAHNIAAPQLGPGKGREAPFTDWGRYRETKVATDRYGFRTPPLRNVTLTGPWLHDGAYADMESVIRHHLDPAAALRGFDLQELTPDIRVETEWRQKTIDEMLASLDPLLTPTLESGLSDAEIDQLIAFLEALTDPAAADLSHIIPDSVPSGLPITDTLPTDTPFRNVTASAGIRAVQLDGYQITGQAWGDYDNDGWLDLYLTDGGGPNSLYRNQGDGTFVLSPINDDVALPDHDSSGAVFADYDNDGRVDLYVVGRGPDVLFRNTGNGFEDVTKAAGIDQPGGGKTASWGDYDADGWLDLYIANWSCIPTCGRPHEGDRDGFYHNNGDGTFTDVTHLLGSHTRGAGFVATFTDFDDDGDPDIYLVNDEFIAPTGNKLWRNDGPGCDGWCFTQIAGEVGADTMVMGMGLATDDFNQDGLLDFYFSNAGEMALLQNQSGRTFSDVAEAAGVALESSAIGWGTVTLDYDNDGDRDIYLALMKRDETVSPFNPLFQNSGDGTFTELGVASGAADPGPSIGVAAADYDRDGRVDLLVGNYRRTYELYRNQGTVGADNNWLTLKLVGGGPVNRDAIGARVMVLGDDGRSQVQEVRSGSSVGSGNPTELYFGLGGAASAQALVRWPDGRIQVFTNLKPNQAYVLTYGDGLAD